jgi:3-phenylpropionate/trans-cinnamate dioxygenase ferredoxin subunit
MTAIRICALDELGQDEALRVDVDDISIAIVKDSSGTVHAIGDICTHGDISLSEGSKFSLITGKPTSLPAYEPVPVYRVTIVDGDVFVDPAETIAV